MPRVVQPGPGERDVTHHGVEVAGRKPGISEGLGANVSIRVERLGNAGGDRVKLHAGHGHGLGCEADERARTRTWFEDAAAVETERAEGLPNFRGQGRIGVVSIDDGPVRGPILVLAQQLTQFDTISLVLGTALIEDLGYASGPPTPPPRQHTALSSGCRPLLLLQVTQNAQRSHVRLKARTGPRWC